MTSVWSLVAGRERAMCVRMYACCRAMLPCIACFSCQTRSKTWGEQCIRTGHGTAHLSFNIDSTGHSETHSHTHTQTQRDTCDMIVDTCTALFIHLHLAERADPHCHTAQRTPVRVRSSALAALVSFCLDSPACACPFPRATYCFSYSFWLSRFACTAVRAGQRSPERLTTCAAGGLA